MSSRARGTDESPIPPTASQTRRENPGIPVCESSVDEEPVKNNHPVDSLPFGLTKMGLIEIYQTLQRVYPFPAGWAHGSWPMSRKFHPPVLEVVAGAILTQNVNWNNVEKALERMIQEGLVDVEPISR